jgi:hypothetical protein
MTNSYSGNDDQADASTRVLRTESNWSSGAGGTGDVKENVAEKAGEVVDQVKQQAGTQLDTQKGRVSETLGSIALAIRQTGTQLHEQDKGDVAQYADKAAEQIERFSTYLRDADMRQITGEVERFARRQPALFLGGALVLGLFGARFLKSSSQQGQDNWDGYGYSSNMAGYSGYQNQGYQDYTSRGMGGYSYSGSGTGAGTGSGVSQGSPYIDRSDGGNYMDEASMSDGNSSGDTNVRQRTWTGTSLEES